MIVNYAILNFILRFFAAQTSCEVPDFHGSCDMQDSIDLMSALQAPMYEQAMLEQSATVEKVASDETSEVVVPYSEQEEFSPGEAAVKPEAATNDIPLLQAPPWSSSLLQMNVITSTVSESTHLLLVSNWRSLHITVAICVISIAWFCAALRYHTPPPPVSGEVPTLSVLAPLALEWPSRLRGNGDKKRQSHETIEQTPLPVPPNPTLPDPTLPWSTRLRELRTAVGWALAACACLGVLHWALGALPGLGVHEGSAKAAHVRRTLLEVIGVGSGLLGACASHVRLVSEGGHHVAEELLQLLGFRTTDARGHLRLAVIAGALSFAALLVQGPLLSGDVHKNGQLLNLSGCDAVIVAAALATLNENCSFRGLVGMTIIRSSSLAVCAFTSREGLARTEMGAGLVSCCFLVAATLCTRLSARAGASPLALFALGSQAAALMSVAHCALGIFDDSLEAEVSGWVVALGLALAVCFALSFYCIAKALKYPYAGECTCVWGANVMVVLALESLRTKYFSGALPMALATPQWPVVAGIIGVKLGIYICVSMPEESAKKGQGTEISIFGFRLMGEELE